MSAASYESPNVVSRDEPCPTELRPCAAFAIGYLASRMRHYQIRLWRRPRELDDVLSGFCYARDSLEKALLLLSEDLRGGVLVHFYRFFQKVLDDLDLIERTVAHRQAGHYRLRRRVPGRASWETLVSLSRRLFVDPALARWAFLGIALSELIRHKHSAEDELQNLVDAARSAASAAAEELNAANLSRLRSGLASYPSLAQEFGLDSRNDVIATSFLWSCSMVEQLYVQEQESPKLVLDFDRQQIVIHGTAIAFTGFDGMHLRLLYRLARTPNEFVAREELQQSIGTERGAVELGQYVSRLRRPLKPVICAYYRRIHSTLPSLAKNAYIEARRRHRSQAGVPGPYRLALMPQEVQIIGQPPEEFCNATGPVAT